MAAVNIDALLGKRQFFDDCPDGWYRRGNYCYRRSRWNEWGRWVALAGIIVAVLLLAFIFSCVNNRRRRRRGAAPLYGTGWIPGSKYPGPPNNNPGYYNGVAAPPYSPPINNQATGNTFNSNEGYYGQNHYAGPQYGQQNGVELQPPQNAYYGQGQRDGEYVYQAPPGSPPGKGDGIIR